MGLLERAQQEYESTEAWLESDLTRLHPSTASAYTGLALAI